VGRGAEALGARDDDAGTQVYGCACRHRSLVMPRDSYPTEPGPPRRRRKAFRQQRREQLKARCRKNGPLLARRVTYRVLPVHDPDATVSGTFITARPASCRARLAELFCAGLRHSKSSSSCTVRGGGGFLVDHARLRCGSSARGSDHRPFSGCRRRCLDRHVTASDRRGAALKCRGCYSLAQPAPPVHRCDDAGDPRVIDEVR